MRRIYVATTALALSLTAPAFAQVGQFTYNPTGQEIEASGFIGARVYTSETDVKDDENWQLWDGSRKDWNDIGEIHDILMDTNGNVQAILVDVGGFLGIGEKQVAMSMDALRIESDGNDIEDYFVVVNSSRDVLEAAPEFESEERAGLNPEGVNVTAAPIYSSSSTADTGAEMADDTSAAMDVRPTPAPGMTDVDVRDAGTEWVAAEAGTLSVDELNGARVYDANGDWVGEIDELDMATDGTIEEAVITVGGFLGLGEKPVAMKFDDLKIKQSTESDEVRVNLSATKDDLMAMPEYEG